jgi:hypothetical protein
MLHQSITGGPEDKVVNAVKLENWLTHTGYSWFFASDLSGPSLVQVRLYLLFNQGIAEAMPFIPERRPIAPGRRDHPGYWCNMQVNHPFDHSRAGR